MAVIGDLKIGKSVRYWFTNGFSKVGRIVELSDRVKVEFPIIGVPPETVSVLCWPKSIDLLD
jgi:hypothetical protein